MSKEHPYKLVARWNGNHGMGTNNVKTYDRSHTVSINNKPDLHLTTDNPHVGDKTKLNPEDLLVSAVASCHMLSYLYLCAMEGIVVTNYVDHATGIMIENDDEGGQFKEITLNPVVTVSEKSMIERSVELHHRAHEICYIANSVNFKIKNYPVSKTENP